jgi:hypothetical protein
VTGPDEVKHQVERAVHSQWMDRAGAFGFASRGVIYALIGIYALALATGHGGGFLDAGDTPREVKRQPFGDALLVALAVGLACHALWRFAEAAFAHHPGAGTAKRLGKRVASIASGLVAAFLSVTAFQHVFGRSGDHGSWIQRALSSDNGDRVVIAVGVGFIVAGVYQLYRAFTKDFRKELETYKMSEAERHWLLRISRFGIAARGAVFPVVGWLLIKAGLASNASQDTGTGAALREISRQTWGMTLLAIVATGLIAYALFMGVNARYRRAVA